MLRCFTCDILNMTVPGLKFVYIYQEQFEGVDSFSLTSKKRGKEACALGGRHCALCSGWHLEGQTQYMEF